MPDKIRFCADLGEMLKERGGTAEVVANAIINGQKPKERSPGGKNQSPTANVTASTPATTRGW